MNRNATQKRELLTRPEASVNIQSQGATHDETYSEFMRIWREERRRRKEDEEFMKSWNEVQQRKKDEAAARYKADCLRAAHFNKTIREREAHKASCEDKSCCKPFEHPGERPLWIKKDATGRCHLVGEEDVSEASKKRKYEDPYAEERPRWKKRWEEKLAKEERLREERKKGLEEYDLWYEEMQTMVAHILENTVDFDDPELMGTSGEYTDTSSDSDNDDSQNVDDDAANDADDERDASDGAEGASDDDDDTDDN